MGELDWRAAQLQGSYYGMVERFAYGFQVVANTRKQKTRRSGRENEAVGRQRVPMMDRAPTGFADQGVGKQRLVGVWEIVKFWMVFAALAAFPAVMVWWNEWKSHHHP